MGDGDENSPPILFIFHPASILELALFEIVLLYPPCRPSAGNCMFMAALDAGCANAGCASAGCARA